MVPDASGQFTLQCFVHHNLELLHSEFVSSFCVFLFDIREIHICNFFKKKEVSYFKPDSLAIVTSKLLHETCLNNVSCISL